MNLISLTEIANQCTRKTPPTWTHEYAMTRITQLVQAEAEAAIAETKEKAAKVCEEYGNSVNNDWNKQLGVADDLVSIADECAAAIRSMK